MQQKYMYSKSTSFFSFFVSFFSFCSPASSSSFFATKACLADKTGPCNDQQQDPRKNVNHHRLQPSHRNARDHKNNFQNTQCPSHSLTKMHRVNSTNSRSQSTVRNLQNRIQEILRASPNNAEQKSMNFVRIFIPKASQEPKEKPW